MLFRKDIPKQCAYCVHCGKLDESYFICPRKGVVAHSFRCHRFRYDPLKRVPEAAPKFAAPNLSQEDFIL